MLSQYIAQSRSIIFHTYFLILVNKYGSQLLIPYHTPKNAQILYDKKYFFFQKEWLYEVLKDHYVPMIVTW